MSLPPNLLISAHELQTLYELTGGKATIRAVDWGRTELRVPARAIDAVKQFYDDNAGSCWRIDVLPLGAEETFTSCIMVLPPKGTDQ